MAWSINSLALRLFSSAGFGACAGVAAAAGAVCDWSPAWAQAQPTKTRIGRNSLIRRKGWIFSNQNCSVFRGFSACGKKDAPMPIGCTKWAERKLPRAPYSMTLSGQYRSPIHIKDLAGDETGVFTAQEQDGSGDLLRPAHPAHGDGAANFFPAFRILQRLGGH